MQITCFVAILFVANSFCIVTARTPPTAELVLLTSSNSSDQPQSIINDQNYSHHHQQRQQISQFKYHAKRQASLSNETNQSAGSSSSLIDRPEILGLRCDEGAEVLNGTLIIKANEPTELILIGRNLDKSNISIALTTEEQSSQSDCTHADRVKSLHFKSLSSTIAQVVIDVPAQIDHLKPYYLCLRGGDSQEARWFHQGSDAWLKLLVREDLLPLYMKLVVIACLLMFSGLFSGLNLGLMALDKNELQVIISCGSETEKRYARAIEPVRRRGNYLLCSILFSNVLVNSTFAVLLEELTSGIVAVMVSTIFIVMFGEILPQAFCSRHGLAVGAKTVLITYFCMIVTFPLSYPVSACLDWVLGEEIGHAYDRERLMEFIRVTRDYNNLETDEVNIISGALRLKQIPLSEIMTRIEDVFMIDINSYLDFGTIEAIMKRGYSRIPVHEAGNRKNIVALLFAKDLALLDPDDRTPVSTVINFYYHPIMFLFEDQTLDMALNEFKTGKSHMAFVRRVIDDGDRDPVYEITGLVTLEDVIEEIMQMEINDETDTLTDNRRKRRRKEAQVRGDFSHFNNLGTGDLSYNVVTPQLCLAAYQYLATTVEPFSPKYISDSILKRLLSQKIYYKVRLDDDRKSRQIYKAGEPVEYFVMILEGRVQVTCGQESLVFDSGPFSYFGRAVLQFSLNSMNNELKEEDSTEVASVESAANFTRKISSSIINKSMSVMNSNSNRSSIGGDNKQATTIGRRLERSNTSANEESSFIVVENHHQPSNPLKASGGSSVSLNLQDKTKRNSTTTTKHHFLIPDYTVEILANTSYLKITRNEYVAALRATLVERGRISIGSGSGSGATVGGSATNIHELAIEQEPLLFLLNKTGDNK